VPIHSSGRIDRMRPVNEILYADYDFLNKPLAKFYGVPVEVKSRKGVTMFDAPADYAPAFIKSAKKVLAALEAKDPFFKKVLDSQRAFANVVVPYTRETSKLSTLISGAAAI
jgi:TRAP-type mannitol/chloroaromatic compound transport system substrate-binding protein